MGIFLTDNLSLVWTVRDLEARDVFSKLLCDFLRREAHCGDVVSARFELLLGRHHNLHQRAQAIVDVHHWHACVRSKVATVLSRTQCVVENLHSVVCKSKA
jgi:hypothetical protein